MLTRIGMGIGFAVLLTSPVRGQDSQGSGSPVNASEGSQTRMQVPPPVSGLDYSTAFDSEKRFNYIRAGFAVSTGYISNLEPGTGVAPVNDATEVLQPSVSFDRSTALTEQTVTYSPSFAMYQPTSVLNTVNQNATADLRFHLAPHVVLRTADSFVRTSAAFGAGNEAITIPGSLQGATPGVLVPFAPEITNSASAILSWQSSRNDMVAGSALVTNLDLTDPSRAKGFFNSSSQGGTASYTHRLTGSQYIGTIGQYTRVLATPPGQASGEEETDTRTASALGFYTVYFQPKFSLSLVAGPQHYDLSKYGVAAVHAWTPSAVASLGWQGHKTSLAASGSRAVTSGSGVEGAFNTSSGAMTGRLQLAPAWSAGAGGSYSEITTVSRQYATGTTSGGHTISVSSFVEHAIGSSLDLTATYTYLHQTYDGIAALGTNPTSDNVVVSLVYHFTRPLEK